MLFIIAVIVAVLGLITATVRAVESIYQLSQTPGLNTLQKCIQVVKNFCKVETYAKE